jgi:hypothetical protein
MRIAFDLDNTLIRAEYPFPLETPKMPFLRKIFKMEEIRAGTREIFEYYKAQNWEIWIYTTSFRSVFYIHILFFLHGIKLDGVINQKIHLENVKKNASKHPPTFGIDLLVDDSEGVKKEGEIFDFQVVCINPKNENWINNLKEIR